MRSGSTVARSTALSPDGTRVAVGGWEHPSVVVVDLASGRELLRLGGFDWPRRVRGLAGARMAAGSPRPVTDYARVWDAATGTLRAVLRGHTAFTYGLDWSADSTRIATAARTEPPRSGIDRRWRKEILSLSAAGTHERDHRGCVLDRTVGGSSSVTTDHSRHDLRSGPDWKRRMGQCPGPLGIHRRRLLPGRAAIRRQQRGSVGGHLGSGDRSRPSAAPVRTGRRTTRRPAPMSITSTSARTVN